ncbi:hypothetical protein PROFUN_03957 [Planoprotostelium fungivorum]|uniref:tRNA/rRNA methyltransferase SpoU type domain-containing protein n=1 Tax=Planoprotostelium fungivorum TaxID=1890364 RepID=A0A2P6MTS2_9EUKA|nr:hypothetical protein PROFUN_03957 [Planoprotostelium fungivorum]
MQRAAGQLRRILTEDNGTVKAIVRLREQSAFRRKNGLVVTEGPSMVFDLIRHGHLPAKLILGPNFLFTSGPKERLLKKMREGKIYERGLIAESAIERIDDGEDIDEIEQQPETMKEEEEMNRLIAIRDKYKLFDTDLISVPDNVMRKLSGTDTPMGVVASFPLPSSYQFYKANVPGTDYEPPVSILDGKKWILVIDEVQDPGNIGTLIRTAAGLGWDGVFVLKNSCDPLNDKAMRASRAAVFHIPVQNGNWVDLKKLMLTSNLQPLTAAPTGESFDKVRRDLMSRKRPPRGYALVLSNEARGLTRDIEGSIDLSVPMMNSGIESLNVATAGGILMSHITNFPTE